MKVSPFLIGEPGLEYDQRNTNSGFFWFYISQLRQMSRNTLQTIVGFYQSA